MVLCLGKPPVRFLWCHSFLYLHFAVVLHLLLLFFVHFPGYFAMSVALHPGFSDPCRTAPALSSTLATFDCICFFIYRKHFGFEWTFFTHRCFFTLCSFTDIFPGFIKAFLGAGSSSLKFAGLYPDPRNTDPVHLFVWFTAIHNLHIQKNWFLSSTKYYHELLGKSLIYLLLTRFKLFSLVQSHM